MRLESLFTLASLKNTHFESKFRMFAFCKTWAFTCLFYFFVVVVAVWSYPFFMRSQRASSKTEHDFQSWVVAIEEKIVCHHHTKRTGVIKKGVTKLQPLNAYLISIDKTCPILVVCKCFFFYHDKNGR